MSIWWRGYWAGLIVAVVMGIMLDATGLQEKFKRLGRESMLQLFQNLK